MNTILKTRTGVAVFTVLLTVFNVIFRRLFSMMIFTVGLPPAIHPVASWLLVLLVPWVPRVAFYSPLIVSETLAFVLIYNRSSPDSLNAYVGTALNIVMIILVSETFRYALNRIKTTNKKLVIERERADLATKRKDIFMAKMSHELRTPLNGIMGITDLIIDSEECKQKGSYLDMIREAAETLKYLIDDLLDLSKIENDLIVFNNNTFGLKNFLDGIVSEFHVSAQKKDIVLESCISDELDCRVNVDGHRLRQIYSNLLTNAIKYTDNGGVIRFEASSLKSPEGDCLLCVKVSDNGIGIPECDHKKIFSSFYRSIESYNNQSSGIGLGLYIVDRLVDLFKGTITVESREGEGSTFTVAIPVKKVCEQTDSVDPAVFVHQKCNPLNILVAEDNRINAVFITSFLEKEGHCITLVDNGNDAVDKACAGFYDLVLMDIQMPLLSGTDAVAKIREYETQNSRTPLVIAAITAYASENEQIEIRKAGFDYYLSKPLDSAKLRSILRNIPGKNGNADEQVHDIF